MVVLLLHQGRSRAEYSTKTPVVLRVSHVEVRLILDLRDVVVPLSLVSSIVATG